MGSAKLHLSPHLDDCAGEPKPAIAGDILSDKPPSRALTWLFFGKPRARKVADVIETKI